MMMETSAVPKMMVLLIQQQFALLWWDPTMSDFAKELAKVIMHVAVLEATLTPVCL